MAIPTPIPGRMRLVSSSFQPAAVRFFHQSPNGIVAQWHNIVIQYRNGPLTAEVIDAVVEAAAGFDSSTEVGAFAVLDGKASIPPVDLRKNNAASFEAYFSTTT